MRNLNIRRLLLAAFFFAALLTAFLGGISAYTIRLLNDNLSSSGDSIRTTVQSELAVMEAQGTVAQMANGILTASTLGELTEQDPAGQLKTLKANSSADFDWSVADGVTSLYNAKHDYLRTSEALERQLEVYLTEVAKLTDDVGAIAGELTRQTLADAGQRQQEISGSTNESTKTVLEELDKTARGTLDDVVLVLQLRGKLLELDVATNAYAEAPSKESGDQMRTLLDEIGEMFGRIPEHVAGPFEVIELQDLKGKVEAQITGKGGLLASNGAALAPVMKALDGATRALDERLLELADNTVFDGSTSLASYLGTVSTTLSGSLGTLIESQDSTSKSIQTALQLASATSATKEALYDLVFLVQETAMSRSAARAQEIEARGGEYLTKIEASRATLTELLTQLGAGAQAESIGSRIDALIAQARGGDGLLARTQVVVNAYGTSQQASEQIDAALAVASRNISSSFRDLSDTLNNSMQEKVAEGGIWMRVQLGLALFIFAVAIGLGFWIGSMVARRLGAAVLQLFALSQRLSASSASLTESSEEQAAVSSEQAASLEESSSTVEEISSMAARNSDSVREAAKISADVLSATNEGTTKMQAMSKGMDELHRASDQISKIIRAIDEIAFQTNILALNAAVEAARAGEAGAGFAVVADEVRALALKCKNAAQETEQLIARNTGLTREGVNMCGSVADSLNAIRSRIDKLDGLIKSISDASQEQSIGLEQINRGLAETSTTTQKNAALAEQGASSAQELNQEAQNLIETIDNLTRLSGVKLDGGKRGGFSRLGGGGSRGDLPSHSDHEPDYEPEPHRTLTFTSKEMGHQQGNSRRLLD